MDLDTLPIRDGFRLRGEAVTRLETFVDAAYAFAVTLLVVSFGAMPDTFAELYDALRRFPAFLAGFAIITMFWASHHRFSRRFGLEDATVMVLSLALVAVTLFYVYPLRMVMSAGMHYMTGGWVPIELAVNNDQEYRLIWVIYGLGFALLSGIMLLLNRHALGQAGLLELDEVEKQIARSEVVIGAVLIGCAALSIALALQMPGGRGWHQGLPGMAYALLGVVLPIYGVRSGRRIDALIAARAGRDASA